MNVCDLCGSSEKRLYYVGRKTTICGDCHDRQMERCSFCDHTRSVHTGWHDTWEMNDDGGDDYVVYEDMCEAKDCSCGNFSEPET